MNRQPTRLVLKVDIDTRVGLLRGVPRLLDLLARLGVKASFYLAMGPDHSGRALRRIFRPGFLRKQLESNAAASFGITTMLYGLVLPGPIIAASAPDLLRRVLDQGHELGLHGWDHVFWHDRMRHLEPARRRAHLGRAWRLFREITGEPPAGFAAPGWQADDACLGLLAEMGLSHSAVSRGRHPFQPVCRDRALPLIEVPTTLPTSDEVLGHHGITPENLGPWLADQLLPGQLNVLTLHAEVEGRALLPAFQRMLEICLARGVAIQRLSTAALAAAQAGPPRDHLVWGPVANRAYDVAWQAGALEVGA